MTYVGKKPADIIATAVDTTTGQFSGTLGVTGETTLSANLNLGDNDKAIFGAGDDLQIFHNATHSYVQDSGTGNLYIAGSNVIISNPTGTETMAYFDDDGAVSLWYNNNVKLATTFTGIDVTGTAVTDGLTVAGNVSIDGGTIKLDGNYPTGSNNTALGNNALDAITTGEANVAIGNNALTANTTGVSNISIGSLSMENNVGGNYNTTVGVLGLRANTSGQYNTGFGYGSLRSNTTASNNTAVGYQAGYSNTTGTGNQSFGTQAAYTLTTGSANTAMGWQALQLATTSNDNSAFGAFALQNNTTGASNVAMGRQALYSNTTANNNTAVGYQAGYSNVTGASNTFLGKDAGRSSTANSNTFLGMDSGYYVTSGANNTILGRYNGNQGGLDIRTSSNNIVLSDGGGNPRGVFDSSGNFLVAKTSNDNSAGVSLRNTGEGYFVRDGANVLALNRLSSDGDLISFFKDTSSVGSIGTGGADIFLGSGETNLRFRENTSSVRPVGSSGLGRDNAIDLGESSARFDDIYATNGTIQTSDRNEKQDIEELSDAEQRVAVVAKGLMRKFRWIDSVAEKGDNARTHFGIIAQDLQDAFTAEGLDAGDYAMFTSTTWWEKEISVDAVEADEENGIEAKDAYTYMDTKEEATEGYTEKTRLGVRYNQLLAFIISAI
jgi:hypothetical protein